jgi:hypothetical protein
LLVVEVVRRNLSVSVIANLDVDAVGLEWVKHYVALEYLLDTWVT